MRDYVVAVRFSAEIAVISHHQHLSRCGDLPAQLCAWSGRRTSVGQWITGDNHITGLSGYAQSIVPSVFDAQQKAAASTN